MADNSSQSSSKFSWWEIAAPALAIILPVVIALAMLAAAMNSNAAPNTGGSMAAQKIDTSPNSPVKAMLKSLDLFSNPTQYLKANSSDLDALRKIVQDFIDKMTNNDPAFASIPAGNRDKVIVLAKDILSQLTLISTSLNQSNIQNKTAAADRIQNDVRQINILADDQGNSSALVTLAKQIVDQNQNGKGIIPYQDGWKIDDSGNLQAADCSGFISYLLNKTGLFHNWEHYNTDMFLTGASSKTSGRLLLVRGKDDLADMTYNDIQAVVQPGDIIISRAGDQHAVMFIGGPDDSKNVVESTHPKGGPNGPQYASLQDRVNRYGRLVAIIRPNFQQ